MGIQSTVAYLNNNPQAGWSTAVDMLLIATSIAAGLLTAQGVALTVAVLGCWCCSHGTPAMQQAHKERVKRRGQTHHFAGVLGVLRKSVGGRSGGGN